jgi:hypothetical protein
MMVKPHPRASGGMVDAPHSKCGDFGRGSSSLPSPIARNKLCIGQIVFLLRSFFLI